MASDGYGLGSSTAADRQAGMMAWLPIVVLAVAQIVVRLIGVAA
jgi:hypothetical protein